MSSSVITLGLSQSDVTTPDGASSAQSLGVAGAVSIAPTGSADAFGLGVGQSDAHATSGDASAFSAGYGNGVALAGSGDATAIGLGIGQSEAHAPDGHATSTSLGVGTATAVSLDGTADATGMGIAQSAAHSGDTAADDQAFGVGHGNATGAGSFAVGSGTGEVVDIGQQFHGVPGEFGSIDLSGFGGGHGHHGHHDHQGMSGMPGTAHGGGGLLGSIVAKFEAAVQNLMHEAHDFLTHATGTTDTERSFALGNHGVQGGGTVDFKGDAGVDLAHGDATRDASFTFTEAFSLGGGKSVSLSFAFAEQDDLGSGKSQIATGFGFSEGSDAHSFASADAGFDSVDTLGFGPSPHQPDALSYT